MPESCSIFAHFSFHGDLAELLSAAQSNPELRLEFAPHQTLKHLIESLRIPHTEIGLVLVNGQPAPLSQRLVEGDKVDVYPLEVQKQIAGETPMFLLDNHLGKLASHLRMLGFDALYRNDYQDEELAELADVTGRVLLTRDRGLLMRKQVTAGYCVRSLDPMQQLQAVIQRYHLLDFMRPFRRCLRCNGELEDVAKSELLDQLLPLTRLYYDDFRRCTLCGQVYWKGSHYQKMMHFIDSLRRGAV